MIATEYFLFLGRGAGNATSAGTLAATLGITQRQLRRLVSRARQEGLPILSGDKGYYLPANGEVGRREMLAFYDRHRRRALRSLALISPVARQLGIPAGQLTIADEGVQDDG